MDRAFPLWNQFTISLVHMNAQDSLQSHVPINRVLDSVKGPQEFEPDGYFVHRNRGSAQW